jgi:hypothetical protein
VGKASGIIMPILTTIRPVVKIAIALIVGSTRQSINRMPGAFHLRSCLYLFLLWFYYLESEFSEKKAFIFRVQAVPRQPFCNQEK